MKKSQPLLNDKNLSKIPPRLDEPAFFQFAFPVTEFSRFFPVEIILTTLCLELFESAHSLSFNSSYSNKKL